MGTTVLFAVLSSFLFGCAHSVEERSAHEKKVNAVHKATINMAKEETGDPYWQAAHAEVLKTPREMLGHNVVAHSSPLPLARLIRGTHAQKSLLLTFDDGPHITATPRLLKILADEHVPATFFVIGKQVEKRPDLLRAIFQAGHTIANHTFSHVTLPKFPIEDQRTEYRANNEIVRKITGVQMRFCRPPGGDNDPKTIEAARAEGLTTVLWTDDPGDFANPGDGIVLDRTLKRLSNGGIILLHDGSVNTLDTLRELIHEARARGYTFVTPQDMVDSLDAEKRARLTAMRRTLPPKD